MKRSMIWMGVMLLIVSVVGGIAVVRAAGYDHHGWYGPRWGFHGPLGLISHELNLSEAQKLQIKTMWQAERPVVATLVQELAAEGKEMDSATTEGNLDDSRVQAIAARQGGTIAKLLVEKELFRSEVYRAVLTSEQRTKADQLEERLHKRLYRFADRFATGGGE